MSVERGIFSSKRKAWAAVAVYLAFLYSTLTLAFNIYVSIFDRMGKPFMSSLMNWMYAPIGLALLALLVLYLPRRPGSFAAFLLIVLAMTYCLNALDVPAKRFHFLQYSILAVLVFEALRFHFRGREHYIWTMVLVFAAGLGDETLQGLLPSRHFGIMDVSVNSAAGLFALLFIGFVLGEEHYPWPARRQKKAVSEVRTERLPSRSTGAAQLSQPPEP